MSSLEESDVRIVRVAGRLRLFVTMLMVGIAVVLGLAWLAPFSSRIHVDIRHHSAFIDPKAAASVSTILLEIALFRLWQMLKTIESGETFSAAVVRHFRAFAFWLLLMAVGGVAVPLLGSVVGQQMIAGAHRTALVIPLTDILLLGVTLLLFLLARLLERARSLEDEVREFV